MLDICGRDGNTDIGRTTEETRPKSVGKAPHQVCAARLCTQAVVNTGSSDHRSIASCHTWEWWWEAIRLCYQDIRQFWSKSQGLSNLWFIYLYHKTDNWFWMFGLSKCMCVSSTCIGLIFYRCISSPFGWFIDLDADFSKAHAGFLPMTSHTSHTGCSLGGFTLDLNIQNTFVCKTIQNCSRIPTR